MARGDEALYRDLLALQLREIGATVNVEAVLPFGRCDLLTRTHVIEVEDVRTWRAGVRQALAYQGMRSDLAGAVALYGSISADLAHSIHIATRDFLDLYLLEGLTWHTVSDSAAAYRAWTPAAPADVLRLLDPPVLTLVEASARMGGIYLTTLRRELTEFGVLLDGDRVREVDFIAWTDHIFDRQRVSKGSADPTSQSVEGRNGSI